MATSGGPVFEEFPLERPRRAEVHFSEKLLLGMLGLTNVAIAGAYYDAPTGNVEILFTGENCPECVEGENAPVVDLDTLR